VHVRHPAHLDDGLDETPPAGAGEQLAPELQRTVAEVLPEAVAKLRERGLVWGADHTVRLVRTARDVLAPSASVGSATGLGPSVGEATAGMSPGDCKKC